MGGLCQLMQAEARLKGDGSRSALLGTCEFLRSRYASVVHGAAVACFTRGVLKVLELILLLLENAFQTAHFLLFSFLRIVVFRSIGVDVAIVLDEVDRRLDLGNFVLDSGDGIFLVLDCGFEFVRRWLLI